MTEVDVTELDVSGLPPPRILIVEDEFLIALTVEDVLHSAGYQVAGIAATYEQAVALAEETRPDLALMDIRLASARDGIEAAIELRRRFDIPSVFASANLDPLSRSRAEPASPAGWLSKPYSSDRLRTAVAAALRGDTLPAD